MTRAELAALRDALTAVLAWPQPVLELVARWLAPEPAKPNGRGDGESTARELSKSNGHDPHPAAASASIGRSPMVGDAPPSGVQARRGKLAKAQAGERKLLAAMQANPGASANALAKAAAMSRSTAADGLRRLAKRGAIERDGDGRWRVKGETASPTPSPTRSSPEGNTKRVSDSTVRGASARPTQPSPAAS